MVFLLLTNICHQILYKDFVQRYLLGIEYLYNTGANSAVLYSLLVLCKIERFILNICLLSSDIYGYTKFFLIIYITKVVFLS